MNLSDRLKTASGRRAASVAGRKTLVRLLHGLGEDDHAMAAQLQVSVRTVANIRRELGLPVHRKRIVSPPR